MNLKDIVVYEYYYSLFGNTDDWQNQMTGGGVT